MGSLGFGYGSEFHLMRFMARYRKEFSTQVLDCFGIKDCDLDWLDFKHGESKDYKIPNCHLKLPDRELTGIDFLGEFKATIEKDWAEFWPTTGNLPNWDAVGKIDTKKQVSWILVEAKAHKNELGIQKGSGAGPDSLSKIKNAFAQTKENLKIASNSDWSKKYYQLANRLAVTTFLNVNGINCYLLNLYFCGDKNPKGECPGSEIGWAQAVKNQYDYLGLTPNILKKAKCASLFLNVVTGKAAD